VDNFGFCPQAKSLKVCEKCNPWQLHAAITLSTEKTPRSVTDLNRSADPDPPASIRSTG
jgi:hypothetical protein